MWVCGSAVVIRSTAGVQSRNPCHSERSERAAHAKSRNQSVSVESVVILSHQSKHLHHPEEPPLSRGIEIPRLRRLAPPLGLPRFRDVASAERVAPVGMTTLSSGTLAIPCIGPSVRLPKWQRSRIQAELLPTRSIADFQDSVSKKRFVRSRAQNSKQISTHALGKCRGRSITPTKRDQWIG
jgi:hypothetical protein